MDMDMQKTNYSVSMTEAIEGKHLTFTLVNDTYGIAIEHVTEIINIQSVTPVPELPVYVKGIINLRGTIIPVMDVRMRFGFEQQSYDDRTCIVVVNVRDITIGLIVDMVQEVVSIDSDEMMTPPKGKSSSEQGRYVKGITKFNDQVILIIDVQRLLNDAVVSMPGVE